MSSNLTPSNSRAARQAKRKDAENAARFNFMVREASVSLKPCFFSRLTISRYVTSHRFISALRNADALAPHSSEFFGCAILSRPIGYVTYHNRYFALDKATSAYHIREVTKPVDTAMANVIPREKQIAVIAALCEGVSIRATERLTGVNRETVMNLGARVGMGCAKLHNGLMRDLNVARLEFDEIWQFVGKKRKAVRAGDPATVGDQYTFVALGGSSKAIISYFTGKRTHDAALAFAKDVRARVIGAPEISTDGLNAYPYAIEEAFHTDCHHGVVVKEFAAMHAGTDAHHRYSPGEVVSVEYRKVSGQPKNISTSFIERQNLTIRMQQRRFTRLTNAFSKKYEHHVAAFALYAAWYNLCRVHQTLRITPAMQLGVTDHVWSIGELIDAALMGEVPSGTTTENPMNLDRKDTVQSLPRRGLFQVITGGKK
jgi:IS1 family transposase